jgi:hypothetical protein
MASTKLTKVPKATAAAAALVAMTVGSLPAAAGPGSATLYELTENMQLDNLSKPTLRTASAALQGTSSLGTPLCPHALIQLLAMLGLPTGATCTVTAFGEDAISLAGGNGSFTGAFAVVANVDNVVDAPELVVMTGSFGAQMQVLADANGQPLPLIRIGDGKLSVTDVLGIPVADVGRVFPGATSDMFAPAPFSGVFRLPFTMRKNKKVRPQNAAGAFYLGNHGEFIPVKQSETSLGFATVRVEIAF